MSIAAPARLQPPAPTKADKARQADQQRAMDAYRGKFKPPFKPEEQDVPPIIPNRCGPVVNTGMFLLVGHGVGIELAENAPEGASDYLKAAWGDEDERIIFLQKLVINCGVYGHGFVQVIPPPRDESNQMIGYARFINVDPATVSIITDEDDCDSVNTFIIDSSFPQASGGTRYKRRIFSRVSPEQESPYGPTLVDETQATWQITTWESQGSAQAFEQVGPTLNWPYPFAPIQDCQNLPNPNEHWGLPDITPSIIDMNEAISFVESNTAKIIYNQAHDIVAIKGANPNQSPIQNEPGKWAVLPPGTDLVTAQAHGDVANSRLFAADLRSDMDEDSGVNGIVMGRMSELPRGAISGIAIKMLYQTALQKKTSRQHTIGKLIRKLSRIHLYFGGFDPDANSITVTLHWEDPLPDDDLAQWQSAPLQEQVGVSKRTILSERGYDYDEELERLQEEAQNDLAGFNAGMGQPPQAQQFANQQPPNGDNQQSSQQPPPQTPESMAMQSAMKAAAAQINAAPGA